MQTLLTIFPIFFSSLLFAQDWQTINGEVTALDTAWEYGQVINVSDSVMIPNQFLKIEVQFRKSNTGVIQKKVYYYKKD